MIFWKTLNGRTPTIAGGGYRYPVGRWTKHLNPDGLAVCQWGYHLARDEQVLYWLNQTLYTAEPCPDHEPTEADNKVVTCRTRLTRVAGWDERTARLFAADCAERVLPIFEKERPDDDRPRKAIEAARLFANGETGAAAWDAARAAAGAAARAAARDAAWAAARAAAWDAARAAAWDAAGAAAWDAARAAARDAARAAAWDAAWAAERDWQYQRFLKRVGVTDGTR